MRTLADWLAQLHREETVSVVQHSPADCADLARAIEAELEALRRALVTYEPGRPMCVRSVETIHQRKP